MTYALLDEQDRCYAITNTRPITGKYVTANAGSGVAVGRYWNGWTFDAPRWTSYEFLKRFTVQERAAIRVKSFQDDQLADFMQFCTAAQIVIAEDPTTVAGMDYLVSLNLLTPARRAEILS
jgi:hypothetical protein